MAVGRPGHRCWQLLVPFVPSIATAVLPQIAPAYVRHQGVRSRGSILLGVYTPLLDSRPEQLELGQPYGGCSRGRRGNARRCLPSCSASGPGCRGLAILTAPMQRWSLFCAQEKPGGPASDGLWFLRHRGGGPDSCASDALSSPIRCSLPIIASECRKKPCLPTSCGGLDRVLAAIDSVKRLAAKHPRPRSPAARPATQNGNRTHNLVAARSRLELARLIQPIAREDAHPFHHRGDHVPGRVEVPPPTITIRPCTCRSPGTLCRLEARRSASPGKARRPRLRARQNNSSWAWSPAGPTAGGNTRCPPRLSLAGSAPRPRFRPSVYARRRRYTAPKRRFHLSVLAISNFPARTRCAAGALKSSGPLSAPPLTIMHQSDGSCERTSAGPPGYLYCGRLAIAAPLNRT